MSDDAAPPPLEEETWPPIIIRRGTVRGVFVQREDGEVDACFSTARELLSFLAVHMGEADPWARPASPPEPEPETSNILRLPRFMTRKVKP